MSTLYTVMQLNGKYGLRFGCISEDTKKNISKEWIYNLAIKACYIYEKQENRFS